VTAFVAWTTLTSRWSALGELPPSGDPLSPDLLREVDRALILRELERSGGRP